VIFAVQKRNCVVGVDIFRIITRKFFIFYTLPLLSTLLLVFTPLALLGQSVEDYAVTRSTGITYNSIIPTGNSFASWRYSGTFSEDDNRSEATPIGFDFWYNGTRYTEFSVSTNGFMDFSSSTDDGGPTCDDYGYCNFQFTASSVNLGTWLALAPFYDDMTTFQGSDPLGTSIKYQVTGTAPNRILTVEWDRMAVYLNTTPDINFQVKLYETTGVIEYVYETMNPGTHSFSYTVGINGSTVSNPPLVSELLTQQSANTTSFNNTPQNNLNSLPASNSKLTFTPETPADPTGSLTFTGVTNTSMTLNWNDWASNEAGYVIYLSTDGTNYFFDSQTSENATSATISGLSPSTNYFWRVYAVTEGTLSTPLEGSQITLSPGTIISVRNGRWDRNNTWDCNCVPTAGDNVIIDDPHRITLRSTGATCNDLTIGQGTSGELRLGRNSTVSYDISINGDVVINPGGRFVTRANSTATHQVTIGGDLTNSGTFNMQIDGNSNATVTFNKTNGDQTVSGNGATTNFFEINVDKGLVSNILEITSDNFTCDPDALNFDGAGTFKFSSVGTNNFSLFNTIRDIPLNGRIWMSSTSSTMAFGNSVNLRGRLTVEDGIVNIGNAANENLISSGGLVEVLGGALNIAGRLDRTDSEATTNFTISGGTLTLPTVGSTSTTRAPFGIEVVGSEFNFEGGSIVLERSGGANLGYRTTVASAGTISGGVLQIGNGNTPVGQTIEIESVTDVPELSVVNSNATASLVNTDINVLSDINLTAGTLDAGTQSISLQGNWNNTGGAFLPGTGTVTFDAASPQSITSSGEPFNNLTLSGTDTKTAIDPLDVNGDLTIDSELATGAGQDINLAGNWINNGVFNQGTGSLILDGGGAQNLDGSSISQYNSLIVNKSSGTVSVLTEHELLGTLDIQSSTTLDADGPGSGILTFVSSASNESRLEEVPSGASITGNVTAQRYLPNASAGRIWRYVGASVSGTTVADLKLNLPVTGTYLDPSTQAEWPAIPGIVENSPSLYRFTESLGGTFSNRYESYPLDGTSSASASLETGRGYALFVRRTAPQTITLRGNASIGNIAVPVSSSGATAEDGWNLVSNPYLSQIDWDNVNIPAGLNNEIHFLDNANNAGTGAGSYVRYVGGVGTPASYSGVIAKGQAFWVRATSTTTLVFEENNKTTENSQFFRESEITNILRVSLTAPNGYDEIAIRFLEEATEGYDSKFDAGQQKTNVTLSSLLQDGTKMGINTLPELKCNQEVALDIGGVKNGEHRLDFFGLETYYLNSDIFLRDHMTGSVQNIRENPVYLFDVTSEPESKGGDRFSIIFEPFTDTDNEITGPEYVCGNESSPITISSTQSNVEYQALINDIPFGNAKYGTEADLTFMIPDSILAVGENTISFVATRGNCSSEMLANQVNIHKDDPLYITKVSNASSCKGGTITLSAESSVPGAKFHWYESFESVSPIEGTVGSELAITKLEETKSYYVSVVSDYGCESERVEAIAEVLPTPEQPTITLKGEVLISSAESGNQWYLDGKLIDGATERTILPDMSGEYSVEATSIDGCSATSESLLFLVTAIEDELEAFGIKVFPNPFVDNLSLELQGEAEGARYTITDMQGKEVPLQASKKGSATLRTEHLKAGSYVLRIFLQDRVVTFPIIKN